MEKLRKTEFLWVFFQNIIDFIFTGVLAALYYVSQSTAYGHEICHSTRLQPDHASNEKRQSIEAFLRTTNAYGPVWRVQP